MNDDVKAMVRWAQGMTESATNSAGDLVAEVEVSDDRLARHIVVRRGEEIEHDSLLVQGSQIRPGFYPADLPFFAGETVHISPKGALWPRTSLSIEERVGEIRESVQEMMADPRMGGFMSMLKKIAGTAGDSPRRAAEELKEAMPGLSADVKDTLKESFEGALSPSGAADEVFEKLLQHHRDEGWDLVAEQDGATPGKTQVATRGDERRKLSLIDMMGPASATLTRL